VSRRLSRVIVAVVAPVVVMALAVGVASQVWVFPPVAISAALVIYIGAALALVPVAYDSGSRPWLTWAVAAIFACPFVIGYLAWRGMSRVAGDSPHSRTRAVNAASAYEQLERPS
jgi:hypothetical protein